MERPSGVRGGCRWAEFQITAAGDNIDTRLDGKLVAGFGDGDLADARVADGTLAHVVTAGQKQMPMQRSRSS